MKFTIKTIAACAILAGASGTFASGTHAGGHGDAHSHGASAIGQAGVASKVTRTIAIEMTDAMRFTPDKLAVKRGETIRFVVTNSGKIKHEFNLGTQADLNAHYELMKKFPGMEHDEPNQISLEPGKTGEVIWQFTKAGKVSFACLHVGHYEAGMKGTVMVGATK
jgi:uncharacterized cupredoxin-like copper-binding protein